MADASDRPIVVAGSVGPTGELFEPMGALTHEIAVASFTTQMRGLLDGGADVAWIETMSSPEEVNAAAEAATAVGLPYVATYSFDTAGRTMMGLLPRSLADTFASQPVAPLAIGANCGVGASDILVTLLHMKDAPYAVVTKGNCGVPHFEGTEAVYSGTPELMGHLRYPGHRCRRANHRRLLWHDAGASRCNARAIDTHVRGERPTIDTIVEQIGPDQCRALENTKRPARRSRR